MNKFSVVIPVFNASKTILDALNSIEIQSIQPFEILLVDDASSDNSLELIKRFQLNNSLKCPLRIISLKENAGVSRCRNIGIDHSTGDFILFLDSDDMWHKDKIRIFSLIAESFTPDLVGHHYTSSIISPSSLYYDPVKLSRVRLSKLLFRNLFQTSCVMMINNSNYRFDETMSYSEDYDLFLKITSSSSNVYFYDDILTKLSRPQLTRGGLSEKKFKMRVGEILAISRVLFKKKLIFLIPFFFIFSWFKYFLKITR